MDQQSQVVIITGGARGIGFGIGQCVAKRGASVIIADINLESAQAAAAQLNGEGAVDSIGLACDVSKRENVQAMVDQVVEKFGRIDVLINNAGICPFIDLMEITVEQWQRTLDINLTGSFHCAQVVARKMLERQTKGRIVFITSLSENVTAGSLGDYAASKSGVRMLMRSFATRLGHDGIRCNAVAPGMILTDMTKHYWEQPEPAAMIKNRCPEGRIGTPLDIGRACVYLASDEAEYVSGITLTVDGGYTTMSS